MKKLLAATFAIILAATPVAAQIKVDPYHNGDQFPAAVVKLTGFMMVARYCKTNDSSIKALRDVGVNLAEQLASAYGDTFENTVDQMSLIADATWTRMTFAEQSNLCDILDENGDIRKFQ